MEVKLESVICPSSIKKKLVFEVSCVLQVISYVAALTASSYRETGSVMRYKEPQGQYSLQYITVYYL